jgi:hypothetical protein
MRQEAVQQVERSDESEENHQQWNRKEIDRQRRQEKKYLLESAAETGCTGHAMTIRASGYPSKRWLAAPGCGRR